MKRQRGVFSIELVFVLFAMGMFLFFIFDSGYQVVQSSLLNRTSNSLVSVLKERSAFFSQRSQSIRWELDSQQASQIHQMALRLLAERSDNVRVSIGLKSGVKSEQVFTAGNNSISCNAKPIQNAFPEDSQSSLNIYRVTVCRRVPAFFENGVLGDAQKTSRILQSTSLFVGR
ncbi:tight adherence pilus pseudopilin TadF [Vibrio navarrensis]